MSNRQPQKPSRSHFDDDFSVPDRGRIGPHRNEAGWQHDLARADVELTLVKIALDGIAIDIALRQGTGAMGAMIVGDVEFPLDIEHRELETVAFDLDRGANGDVRRVAQLELPSARRL